MNRDHKVAAAAHEMAAKAWRVVELRVWQGDTQKTTAALDLAGEAHEAAIANGALCPSPQTIGCERSCIEAHALLTEHDAVTRGYRVQVLAEAHQDAGLAHLRERQPARSV